VASEMRKVSWPSWQTVLKYFSAVVIGVAFATVLVWALDYFFIHIFLSAIIK
jgi:preprotein translocase SecE subunit